MRYIVTIAAIILFIISFGLADAFFFNFFIEDEESLVSGLTFAYILTQFIKTILTRHKPTYNYTYFIGVIGVLALYYGNFKLEEFRAVIQFVSVIAFLFPPILDVFGGTASQQSL
jgi:hypothetical protein